MYVQSPIGYNTHLLVFSRDCEWLITVLWCCRLHSVLFSKRLIFLTAIKWWVYIYILLFFFFVFCYCVDGF